jgi:hypothetical protein
MRALLIAGLVQGNAMTFGAKADKLYRTLAGRRAYTICGAFTDSLALDSTASSGARTLARKRGAVRLSTGGRPDVCALATRPKNLEDSFCRQLGAETPDWCARVIVPVTARGRAYVDRLQGVVTLTGADDQITSLPPDWAPTPVELLQGAVEADVVALDAPDAAPPPASSASSATVPTTRSRSCSPTANACSFGVKAT